MKFVTHPLSPDLATSRDMVAAPLDLELALRLRKSMAGILEHGQALADVFYAELFRRYPEVRPMFRQDMSVQKQKLLQTLEWIVGNLDRPAEVRTMARDLGKKHETYGAKAAHYPLVRDVLVESMAKVAGTSWSRELEADWRLAIDLLASIMTGQTAVRRGERTHTKL